MTGSPGFSHLLALAFTSSTDLDKNLASLVTAINNAPDNALVVAPEVAVTDFDYEHFEQAASYAKIIDSALLEASHDKTIIITLIEKREQHFFNVAKVYHHGTLIHTQAKHKLFTLGDETKHFSAEEDTQIVLFEINGVKVGILICFELRFTHLWQRLQGADIIVIPAQWGKIRSDHFTTLSKALAICNQCYVIACDSANSDCTNYQAVIDPFGEQFLLSSDFDPQKITKMRRYLNTGIPCG